MTVASQRRGVFLKKKLMIYYCLGVTLDANFCERTCKKRENCKYYDLDIYAHYKHMWNDMDFLVCFEPCQYYLPKHEEVKVELSEEENIFAI